MYYPNSFAKIADLRNTGVSNRIARSTLEQVKARYEARILRDKAPKGIRLILVLLNSCTITNDMHKLCGSHQYVLDPKIAFEERLKREEVERLQKKQAKKEKKAMASSSKEMEVDDQTMALMGFGAFGSSKG